MAGLGFRLQVWSDPGGRARRLRNWIGSGDLVYLLEEESHLVPRKIGWGLGAIQVLVMESLRRFHYKLN